jgi:CRISPR/Cas system-associated exonuclease Cas4 (RecB family)
MNCSIDLFDVASKQLIKKCVVEISEKNIASVKKTLWELGAVIVGAKIPQPTKNKNKCAVCLLNKKNLCDFGLQQS